MVTEADFVAATRIRLPTRYAFHNRDGVIDEAEWAEIVKAAG